MGWLFLPEYFLSKATRCLFTAAQNTTGLVENTERAQSAILRVHVHGPACPEVPAFPLTPPLKPAWLFTPVSPHVSPHSRGIPSGPASGLRVPEPPRIAHVSRATAELRSTERSGNCSLCHTHTAILHNSQPLRAELLCRAACAHQRLQWAQKGFWRVLFSWRKAAVSAPRRCARRARLAAARCAPWCSRISVLRQPGQLPALPGGRGHCRALLGELWAPQYRSRGPALGCSVPRGSPATAEEGTQGKQSWCHRLRALQKLFKQS